MEEAPPPGYYVDPTGTRRWWDGSTWGPATRQDGPGRSPAAPQHQGEDQNDDAGNAPPAHRDDDFSRDPWNLAGAEFDDDEERVPWDDELAGPDSDDDEGWDDPESITWPHGIEVQERPTSDVASAGAVEDIRAAGWVVSGSPKEGHITVTRQGRRRRDEHVLGVSEAGVVLDFPGWLEANDWAIFTWQLGLVAPWIVRDFKRRDDGNYICHLNLSPASQVMIGRDRKRAWVCVQFAPSRLLEYADGSTWSTLPMPTVLVIGKPRASAIAVADTVRDLIIDHLGRCLIAADRQLVEVTPEAIENVRQQLAHVASSRRGHDLGQHR